MDEAMSAYTAGMVEAQGNNRNNNGMFGDGCWWIWIILLFFCWGGNGWGNGFGGNGNNGGGAVPYLSGVATRSDISEGFALNGIQSGITGIQQGICDSTYALNNSITGGFNNTNVAMLQGFNGVDKQMCNIGFQLQDCCCQTQRAIDGVNYNMATNFCNVQNTANNNTRDIIQSTHNDTDRIIAQLNAMEATRQQEKIQSLQAENQGLKFAASQSHQNSYIAATMDAQTAELIRRCCPTPIPAYQVPAPYPYAANCGCGSCGC